MGRKRAMAYPSSPCGAPSPSAGSGAAPQPRASAPAHRVATEGEHQLEKLQFALAVALTRGDLQRSELLRHQIDVLGGNQEEPGT